MNSRPTPKNQNSSLTNQNSFTIQIALQIVRATYKKVIDTLDLGKEKREESFMKREKKLLEIEIENRKKVLDINEVKTKILNTLGKDEKEIFKTSMEKNLNLIRYLKKQKDGKLKYEDTLKIIEESELKFLRIDTFNLLLSKIKKEERVTFIDKCIYKYSIQIDDITLGYILEDEESIKEIPRFVIENDIILDINSGFFKKFTEIYPKIDSLEVLNIYILFFQSNKKSKRSNIGFDTIVVEIGNLNIYKLDEIPEGLGNNLTPIVIAYMKQKLETA